MFTLRLDQKPLLNATCIYMTIYGTNDKSVFTVYGLGYKMMFFATINQCSS